MVITASAAGLLTQVGSLPYSVTKHAAVSTAEWLAISYAEHDIKVSCLCPQAGNTGMLPDDSGGGAAGEDGVLGAEEVAEEVLAAMDRGDFLILPHKSVHKYYQRRSADTGRWLKGMSRLHQQFGQYAMRAPPMSAAKL